jgi:hypothetical protein
MKFGEAVNDVLIHIYPEKIFVSGEWCFKAWAAAGKQLSRYV